MSLRWNQSQNIESKKYTCGYCGNPVASAKGYIGDELTPRGATGHRAYIYICHHCDKPTFFESQTANQTPGVSFGNDVKDISDAEVESLYKETRDCYSANAFTSAVLACRKLLMHIAVNKGAKEGDSFIAYVEFLSDKGFVPPDAKDWVDHIREKGNEANHEIRLMSKEDAEDLVGFTEMLLKLIYEFPANIKRKREDGKAEKPS